MDKRPKPPIKVVLCSGGGTCCPVVTIYDDITVITGDPGHGEMDMTNAQFRELIKKAKEGAFDD